jgi:hypothetical protein
MTNTLYNYPVMLHLRRICHSGTLALGILNEDPDPHPGGHPDPQHCILHCFNLFFFSVEEDGTRNKTSLICGIKKQA